MVHPIESLFQQAEEEHRHIFGTIPDSLRLAHLAYRNHNHSAARAFADQLYVVFVRQSLPASAAAMIGVYNALSHTSPRAA